MSTQDRFRGLMLGTAVGDALGRPFEGHRQVSDRDIELIHTHLWPLTYTDDTAMTLSLAESLLACDGFDGADMSRRFVDTFFEEPWRGYGSSIVDVFDRVRRGKSWATAAAMQFDGSGSYGNGAAMRAAPTALWAYPDLELTIHLARETAKVTHTHPAGVDGAVMQAYAAHHALNGGFTDRDRFIAELSSRMESDEFKDKLATLLKALDRDDDEYARLHLGNWVAAHNSVVTALYVFLLGDGFEDTVIRAIRLGGDADTIAAMAGALAGALHGLTGIPEAWRDVEEGDRLLTIADAMHERTAVPWDSQSRR